MRIARLLAIAAIAAAAPILVTACSSGAQPGWTYAPPPSPTPLASVIPSGEPSAAPSAVSSAAPSSGGTGTVLNLEASGVQYLETALEATAGQAFQIAFDNQDASIPHNVQIADGSGQFVFNGDTVTGPGKITYNVPALPAGTYKFSCKWHPNMVGELTVK